MFKAFIIGKKTGRSIRGGYIRGMFGFFFTEGPVYNLADARKSYTTKFVRFFQGMPREGVCFGPSQFEAVFTSLAHTAEDIQKTIAAAEKFLPHIQSFCPYDEQGTVLGQVHLLRIRISVT
ncbi:hypothetical protein SADUNF_Sadunf12G0080300 [Salix dunnii]|uniref:Uncharacterized protein n=1 Tax=Salix dunnii TaxID=1413687 RepID=A0A835JM73_9ROSI|nr:hypothetical protein SADUNF_Sadunf12G0080300 [Salix dunnii]